jgi:hypothetical protein
MRLRALLFLVAALPAHAALYWNAGVRGPKPTVCFAGDGATAQPARVQQIKEYLTQFEHAANIRFTYKSACTNQPKDGKDFWLEDIRVVIPGTGGDLFGKVKPVPGNGCPMADPGGGGWSNSPAEFDANRPCVFNMHLGNDNFTAQQLGDPSGGATPFVNHTLHEFGHALGLSHEHERLDVDKSRVLGFLDQIEGVDATKAQAIYDAGYRNWAWIAGTPVATLQQIPGFTTVAAATALRDNAKKAEAAGVPVYGGGGTFFMTPYDPLSVMHYTWNELKGFAPGNYANTGLSGYDRLALHILYPEDARVAELLGRRVLRTGETLDLVAQWEAAGADMAHVAKNFAWKLDGATASTTTRLKRVMPAAGTFRLELTHADLLDRGYAYTGEVRVLEPPDFAKRISARVTTTLPLM